MDRRFRPTLFLSELKISSGFSFILPKALENKNEVKLRVDAITQY